MLIQVTQEIIDAATVADCNKCAIALAIKAVLDPKFTVAVGAYSAHIRNKDGVILLSPSVGGKAQSFIRRFDQGEKMQPIEFEMDIPEHFLKTS